MTQQQAAQGPQRRMVLRVLPPRSRAHPSLVRVAAAAHSIQVLAGQVAQAAAVLVVQTARQDQQGKRTRAAVVAAAGIVALVRTAPQAVPVLSFCVMQIPSQFLTLAAA